MFAHITNKNHRDILMDYILDSQIDIEKIMIKNLWETSSRKAGVQFIYL